MGHYIKTYKSIGINDLATVGGKNASLGEMYNHLITKGVRIPNGFATTSAAFWEYLQENALQDTLEQVLDTLDRKTYFNLKKVGEQARKTILNGTFSADFRHQIQEAYRDLGDKKACATAVRSSATAEDLPDASFAGQHDTFLNVKGEKSLLKAIKMCYASLFTDRAIKYREDKGFEHTTIAISVGVQHMVRADKGCSGVGFTVEPESGFKDVIVLSGVWGLGENIVQGIVTPDEFYVFKPSLDKNLNPIIQKRMGDKKLTMIYAKNDDDERRVRNVKTILKKQKSFVLSDNEVITLARWAKIIEDHYKIPMDIEWAKDGITNELYITQARPETVHHIRDRNLVTVYKLLDHGKSLCTGSAIGSKISVGVARLLESPKDITALDPNTIIVTDTITPDWDPILKQVQGIVTNKGGRTSHAAIVARELGVPAIVGCGTATKEITDSAVISLSCAQGKAGHVYEGVCSYEKEEIDFSKLTIPKTEAKMILADPENAFQLSFIPNNGVGLLRMEFIITHLVKIHPMALVHFEKLKQKKVRDKILLMTENYLNKEDYFIDTLSQGIATIGAAFYPKEVILRLSDFKTNEYANLIGGVQFEPKEENPMLGLRGASRYYNELYRDGFVLECKAIKRVREEMGFTNIKVMVPFCRTLGEGKKVLDVMKGQGLKRGNNGLEVYMMLELPSNILLAEEFAQLFDGFSIGSNDLTQFTLGIDRDSEVMGSSFSEEDAAVKRFIKMAITAAHKTKTTIGFCGQAPSDFPEYAKFLVASGIDSISFNPDAFLQGMDNMYKAEKTLKK